LEDTDQPSCGRPTSDITLPMKKLTVLRRRPIEAIDDEHA
jgi:hypothetical protein